MNLRRSFTSISVALLVTPFLAHAATQASCTFETFAAPSGYTLSQVQGINDEGTVVGQVVNNTSMKFVAFTRSGSGVITLYQARWYLDDLASAVRLLRNRHRDTPDTRQWRDSLAPWLEQLPRWLELLS